MNKVAITGATGMLGLALTEKCIKENVKVVAFVTPGSRRMSRVPKNDLVQIVQCDMSQYGDIANSFDGCGLDVFFHFAWGHTSHAGRNDEDGQNICVEQSLDAVRLAKKMGANTFVFAGSQAQYGRIDGLMSENMECNPITPYAKAKMVAEINCKKLCDELGLRFISLRIFSIYGPYIQEFTMVSTAVRNAMNGVHMDMSAGLQTWNFLYQDDFADQVYGLATNTVAAGVYNIGHPYCAPLKDFLFEMKEAMPTFDFSLAEPDVNNIPASIEPDMSKTIEAAGIVPTMDFKEGIRRMYKFYEENLSNNSSV